MPATTADIAGDGSAEADGDGVPPPPGPAGAVLGAAVPVRSTLGPGEVAPSPAPPLPVPPPPPEGGEDSPVAGVRMAGGAGEVPGGWGAEMQQAPADEGTAGDRGPADGRPAPRDGAAREMVQPDRGRRIEGMREATGPQRACPLPDRHPLGHRPGRAIRDEPEHLMPQGAGQRGHRQHAEQGDRAELAALPLPAHGAVPDVPPDPLAEQHGEPAVPAFEDPGQLGAGFPAGAGHQQHAERRLEVSPGPGGHGVGLVTRDAERVGEVGASQLVPEVQLDDLPFAGSQAGQG